MKGKFNKALLQKRGRIVIRIAVWGAIVVFSGISWLIVESVSAIKAKNAAFSRFLSLTDSVHCLQPVASDSLLAESARLSKKGVLAGWEGAAGWLDTIQSYCHGAGVDMEYRIDSLLYPAESVERLRLLPLNLYLTSKAGEFETVMRLFEKICGDTASSVLFTNLEIIKDNTDRLKTVAVVYRWIEP